MMLKSHSDVEPVEHRRFGDVGVGENASKASTTIGEGCQRGVFGLADGFKVSTDQQFDVRVGSGDSAKNLAAARRCLDIANTHLEVTFCVLATSDEGGIQSDRDARCRDFRPNCGTIANGRTGFQGVATQGLLVLSGADRKQLLQNIRGRPVGHQGGEMGLKLIQFRCRSAMRWPADTDLDAVTRGTAKSGKSQRDLAEKRRYRVIAVVLHAANAPAAEAVRSPYGVVPDLLRDELLLDARQQQLSFGKGQAQIGDIAETIGPVNLHDVRALPIAFSPELDQPQNPRHASTPIEEQTQKYPFGARTPNFEPVP
jgi:hypothetical protein